jgi:hypothetical protein
MGNSVSTWNKHYYISRRNREAAAAIQAHSVSVGQRRAGNHMMDIEAAAASNMNDGGAP